jgi:hypothetical protein
LPSLALLPLTGLFANAAAEKARRQAALVEALHGRLPHRATSAGDGPDSMVEHASQSLTGSRLSWSTTSSS